MIDKILKELWDAKDNIAKEHGYDLDNLVAYLQFKSKSRSSVFFERTQNKEAEQGAPAKEQKRGQV